MRKPIISIPEKYFGCGPILLICCFITIIFACDDGGSETADDEQILSRAKGAFELDITWPENTPMSVDGIDCSKSKISLIIGKMYDESGVLLSSKEFNCSRHKGTLDNIQPGHNRWIQVTVLDSEGNIVYQGEENGITINQGTITQSKGILMAAVSDNLPADTRCHLRGDEGDFTNYFGMSFNLIVEEGSPVVFPMGSPETEVDRNSNETRHDSRLSQTFYIQTTEVTQCQWEQVIVEAEEEGMLTLGVLDKNPSFFEDCPDCPVEQVSWNDIQNWIAALNQILDDTYALPTEVQWEYSCRAGNYSDPFAFGICLSTDKANYNGNNSYHNCPAGIFRGSTIKVASLYKNKWGLYDMHGNVWEWAQDGYAEYPITLETHYVGSGSERVLRGGGWSSDAMYCRSAYRVSYGPSGQGAHIGFRLTLLPGLP